MGSIYFLVMYRVYKQTIDIETIKRLNQAIDEASADESFEILIPPKTTEILTGTKEKLLAQCREIVWPDDAYVVIRSVTEKGALAAQCWHFDNFRTTTLVVLRSTTGTDNGDLLVRSDLRGEPRSLFFYVLTKLFWTNPLTWLVLRIKFFRDKFFTRVPLEAGDVLVFDGGTTYHGNLPITLGMRRSILIHSDPLFADAAITKLFHTLNKLYLYKT